MSLVFRVTLWWILLLVATSGARTQSRATDNGRQKPEATLFFMDGKGNYKYAFANGNGYEGEQSANQANEVTGYYTYYDQKGAPYMVKYKAGILGYQPEVIQSLSNDNDNFRTSTAIEIPKSLSVKKVAGISPTKGDTTLQSLLPSSSSTLKFVQHAMQSMQTQPLQVSFSAHQSHLPTVPAQPQTPLSHSEVRQMTTLQQPPQQQQRPHPYAYSYLADQSAHSESADRQGNVMGKYSYYDEAGYHDLTYSAGDDTGFVILGGNLVKSKVVGSAHPMSPNQLVVNFSQLPQGSSYNYKVAAVEATTQQQNGLSLNNLEENSSGRESVSDNGRSLRKFRRYAKW